MSAQIATKSAWPRGGALPDQAVPGGCSSACLPPASSSTAKRLLRARVSHLPVNRARGIMCTHAVERYPVVPNLTIISNCGIRVFVACCGGAYHFNWDAHRLVLQLVVFGCLPVEGQCTFAGHLLRAGVRACVRAEVTSDSNAPCTVFCAMHGVFFYVHMRTRTARANATRV